MEDEEKLSLKEKRKLVLTIDYQKLLAYVAAAIVSLYVLFHVGEVRFLPYLIRGFSSSIIYLGIVLFTIAGIHNFKEIIQIEYAIKLDDLKIKGIKRSGWFSKLDHNGKPHMTTRLYFVITVFLFISFLIYLSITYETWLKIILCIIYC